MAWRLMQSFEMTPMNIEVLTDVIHWIRDFNFSSFNLQVNGESWNYGCKILYQFFDYMTFIQTSKKKRYACQS